MAINIQSENNNSATNCADCERYRKLGDLCVLEHGKKFLWEYCKDFEHAVELPDYGELMKSVKQDMALKRKKIREKKKKEVAQRRKVREQAKKEKLRAKRSLIAKRVWEKRRTNLQKKQMRKKQEGGRPGKEEGSNRSQLS